MTRKGQFKWAPSRCKADTLDYDREAAEESRWLPPKRRGRGLRERSSDAADAERAGQKLRKLPRASQGDDGADWRLQ